MEFKNVTVAGSGVLGSQIAYQVSYKGFNVTVYDINAEAVEAAKTRMEKWQQRYKEDLNASDAEVKGAFERISFSIDLKEAVKDADLIIEAVPEKEEIKLDFYKKLAEVAPEKTIFASNSSTMLPSQFAEATGRPSQFLMLHFANEIWKNNTAEIMKHPGTDMTVFDEVVEFARAIGMVPLPLYKEQPGYILNSLLVPFLDAAESLLVKEVADPETIDKTWMIGTGAPLGPFAILDIVGINTAYNIVEAKASATDDENMKKLANLLKTEYIEKGKLGRATGEGFYTYPNPSFAKPDFLKG